MVNNIFMGQLSTSNPVSVPPLKLDTIDRKILVLLADNGRVSHSSIARKLNVGRETVAYRLRRMKELNFLHGSLTLLNTRQLGFRNYVVYIKYLLVRDAQQLIDDMKSKSEVTRIKKLSGLFDLQLTFCVRSPEELVRAMDHLTQKHHSIIQTYELMEIIEEDFLGFSLLAEPSVPSSYENQPVLNAPASAPIETDQKDFQILDALKLQGDIPLLELSRQIELAPIAVRNRIRRMERAGIIKQCIPLVSLDQIGFLWWKVLIKGKALPAARFKTYLYMHPNILWYMSLLGRWDYQISIFAQNHVQFHQILDELRENFSDHILHYDTLIVFNQQKFVQRIR